MDTGETGDKPALVYDAVHTHAGADLGDSVIHGEVGLTAEASGNACVPQSSSAIDAHIIDGSDMKQYMNSGSESLYVDMRSRDDNNSSTIGDLGTGSGPDVRSSLDAPSGTHTVDMSKGLTATYALMSETNGIAQPQNMPLLNGTLPQVLNLDHGLDTNPMIDGIIGPVGGLGLGHDVLSVAGIQDAAFAQSNTTHISNNPEAVNMMMHGAPSHGIPHPQGEPSAMSSGSRHTAGGGDETMQTGRVDASKMEVLENPLSKSDRYTVIKGRLPDTDPYMQAAKKLGLVFMSHEMSSTLPDLRGRKVHEEERKAYFLKDIEAFNKELNREYKIPIIGGGQLSLYALAMEVMKLGGLKNVVINRAFRIVGQQLELPKSCTSAAFVLKNAYERLLYLYEQKLAFGTTPKNPQRTIDMKSVVSETKRRNESSKSRSKKSKQGGVDLGTSQGRVYKKTVKDERAIHIQESTSSMAVGSQNNPIIGDLHFTGVGAAMAGADGIQMENLTPQQREPSGGHPLPESTLPNQDWTGNGVPITGIRDLEVNGDECNANETGHQGLISLPSTVMDGFKIHPGAAPDHIDVQLKDRMLKTEQEALFAVFGSNDSVRALHSGAKILSMIRLSKTPVKLAGMERWAGATLISAIVQGLANYLECLRMSTNPGWRGVIARCGGEMLRILLLDQENIAFTATSKNLWLVMARILSCGSPADPVLAPIWAAISLMAPYMAQATELECMADLLHTACDCLCKSSDGAVQISWFISGSVRGLTSKMDPEHNELVDQIFSSLVAHNASADSALRHATMSAMLHLSRVYPEKAGRCPGLIPSLIEQLTEPANGGLCASTLYYITQASPETLHGFEEYLMSQTQRVASTNAGPQADQMDAILGLLTGGISA